MLLSTLDTNATMQIPDILIYKSDTVYIYQFPFEAYIQKDLTLYKKIFNHDEFTYSSSCWRGYMATWHLENDSLFLGELSNTEGTYKFNLDELFNSNQLRNGRVFANWYNGEINAQFGDLIISNLVNAKEDIYSQSLKCIIEEGIAKKITIDNISDCELAKALAQKDFYDEKYAFHSVELVPNDNSLIYTLNKYYNIKWYFTDSLAYYNCYDEEMMMLLEYQFGESFMDKAAEIADSLENTENWMSYASFESTIT